MGKDSERKLIDRFINQKSVLIPGEHDRPLMDRLWDAAPAFKQRDEKLLK